MKSQLSAIILSFTCLCQAAVTGLNAEFRGGKTYITWSEEAGSGHTYNLYRSGSPITDVSAMTPLVNIPDSSSYDRSYNLYHVVRDTAAPLTPATGFFVYTPRDTEDAYYAVTVIRSGMEDKSLTAGINSLSSAVQEQFWPVPQGVMRTIGDLGVQKMYTYEYYMDYFTWPDSQTQRQLGGWLYRSYESYGVYYAVAAVTSSPGRLPVRVPLHALSSAGFGLPSGSYYPDAVVVYFRDPNNTFFKLHTRDRVIACLRAFMDDPRFADVTDYERVFMYGGSMGACGTYEISHGAPELFSALNPQWGYTGSAHLDSIERTPWIQRPPMMDFFGYWDGGDGGISGHRRLINAHEKARQGLWTKWENASHGGTTSGVVDDQVPGGWQRFKRHECYPALTRFSLNDNYGALDSTTAVTQGFTNHWIDWTSSLHDLGLPNDELVDNADSVAITFKALKPGAVADITPRRLQVFSPVSGTAYHWRNQDVATGAFVDGGLVIADTARIVTVPSFQISETGSRLVISGNDPAGFVKVIVMDSVRGTPLMDAHATLSTTPASKRVTDAQGTAFILSSPGAMTLDVSCATFAPKSAIAVAVVQNDTSEITIRLSQLSVTGLVFVPDSFTLGQTFTYKPGIFTRHSDNALYPATEGVIWATTPANIAAIDGQYVITALNPGNADVAASFQSFSDTLHLNVVDTAAQPDSVILTYPSKVIDADAPFKLHATCIYKKVTTATYYYASNVDSIADWSTSDGSVATVAYGVVVGHDTGNALIIAQAGAKSDTCRITIRPTPSFVKRVNFQAPQNANLETVWYKTGWTINYANSLYSAAAGCGWLSGTYLDARSDRAGSNFLLKSFVTASQPAAYRIDAPDGKYVIRTAVGDNIYGGTDWVACGSDTLVLKDWSKDTVIGGITYQNGKYNKIEDDTVIVSGGAGIQLTVKGCINYLVFISAEGIPMDLVADDDGVPDDPPDTLIMAAGKAAEPVAVVGLTAFPNPFNPSVNIVYALPAGVNGIYRIYNTAGQCVFSSALASSNSGARGRIVWGGRNLRGAPVASGLYIGRLMASDGKTLVQKLLLMR